MGNFLFNTIKVKEPKKSVFDLSHERKFSMNMGDLVPIACMEVLPGDEFKFRSDMFMRLAPMIAPVMHRVNVFTHFFFVPNRLIWENWQKFIIGLSPEEKAAGDLEPVFPVISLGPTRFSAGEFMNGSLSDYLGLPTIASDLGQDVPMLTISQLPFRAYQLIYNEYYRDQNLTDLVDVPLGDGVVYPGIADPNDPNDPVTYYYNITRLRKRCWEKDYFTSALPWAQKGEDVGIPGVGSGGQKVVVSSDFVNGNPTVFSKNGVALGMVNNTLNATSINSSSSSGQFRANNGVPVVYNPGGTLEVESSDFSTGGTINNLRRAFALQRWFEKNARGGSRYKEVLFNHFGETVPDARLQRPEYLGGGKSPVIISEVLQTSSSDDESPQGNMSGHGISAGSTHSFQKRFQEHGYIIGIMSVLPRTAYQQGVPRHFFKFDKLEYGWPDFANLGEQEIKMKELDIYATDLEETFGYTPRYAEYKFERSSVHGEMRDSLMFWHMGRVFNDDPSNEPERPKLNHAFVEANPTRRIFAVEDEELANVLYVQLHNDVMAIRKLPKYGTPGM